MIKIPGESDQTTAKLHEILLGLDIWQNTYSILGLKEINRSLKYLSTIPNASAVVFNKKGIITNLGKLNKFSFCGDWYAYIVMLSKSEVIYNHEIHNIFRRASISHSIMSKKTNAIIIKTEYFRILQLLLSIKEITNKKDLIFWFTKRYTGFGFATEGLKNTISLLIQYYKISFLLASKVLIAKLFISFSSLKQ